LATSAAAFSSPMVGGNVSLDNSLNSWKFRIGRHEEILTTSTVGIIGSSHYAAPRLFENWRSSCRGNLASNASFCWSYCPIAIHRLRIP
jgi:hypothetical protein